MNRLGAVVVALAAVLLPSSLPFFLKPLRHLSDLDLGGADHRRDRPQSDARLCRAGVAGAGRLRRHRRLHRGAADARRACRYPLAFVAAGLLCFAIGWVLGYPALRVQHHYLAFVTLAFTTLVFLVLRNEEWLTGGIYGINGIAAPGVVRLVDRQARCDFYFFCLGMLAVLSLATWWMLRSPWGRAFVALARKSDPRAVARPRHAPLHADGLRHRLEPRRPVRRALCAAGAIHRAELVRARAVVQSAADGDRRRQRLFLRAVCRRAGRRAAAGMAALHPGLLPHRLCRAGHGDDGVLPVRHARIGRARHQGADGRRAAAAAGAAAEEAGP